MYSLVISTSGSTILSEILYNPIPAIESPTNKIGFYQFMAKLVHIALNGLFSEIA